MAERFYWALARGTVGVYVGLAVSALCAGRWRQAALAGLFAAANGMMFWV